MVPAASNTEWVSISKILELGCRGGAMVVNNNSVADTKTVSSTIIEEIGDGNTDRVGRMTLVEEETMSTNIQSVFTPTNESKAIIESSSLNTETTALMNNDNTTTSNLLKYLLTVVSSVKRSSFIEYLIKNIRQPIRELRIASYHTLAIIVKQQPLGWGLQLVMKANGFIEFILEPSNEMLSKEEKEVKYE